MSILPAPGIADAAQAVTLRTVTRTDATVSKLLSLDVGAILKTLFRQSPAFLLTWTYVLFEYVRPQSIYTFIDFAPWSQILLFGATAFVLLEGRARFTARSLWAGLVLFSLAVFVSSFSAVYPSVSWSYIGEWVNWSLLMFVVGAGVRNKSELFLMLFGFMLWNLKMSQHGFRSWAGAGFQFRNWGVTGAPGWFQNSGEFGIEMCIFLPLAGYFAYALWPHLSRIKRLVAAAVVVSAVVSIVGSSSRGALLGLAVVALWLVLISPYRLRALAIVVVVSAVVVVFLPEESLNRFREMGSDKTSTSRLIYWEDALEISSNFPLFGIGYKNWIPYYRTFYNPEGELPHNFALECLAELGVFGMVGLIAVLFAYFFTTYQVRNRARTKGAAPDRLIWALSYGLDGAMIGFMVSGSFVTVLFYPFIWMNVALACALHRVSKSTPDQRIDFERHPKASSVVRRDVRS